MEIRLAGKEDLEGVALLLNEVTLDLQKRRILQWEYPWDEKALFKQQQSESLYVVVRDEEIIGTFCLSEIDSINDLVVDKGSKYLAQLAIIPAFQGRNVGSSITEFACDVAERVNKSLYLDCWAGNGKLRAFYTKNGFACLGNFKEADYFISVFRYN
ncbi:GNAT family N-acetyltransferase [Alkalihalophilus lindianensis]|uniref:GNAT family N-acetyltransferase n=1 Tax=Alkalihalophilus lindianensis TaxID=1630542 RepID=A0ABU3X4N6_9BACI|nr:GNAT family N-acetyltransferase [Alkalihalophilus lindianensis]MDV2682853.1 GNAT family N-acetyltransferase [Alkalihalophilus lindianensis]